MNRLKALLASPVVSWALALIALLLYLNRELPTDFLEIDRGLVDAAHGRGGAEWSAYAPVLRAFEAVPIPRRDLESILHALCCVLLLRAILLAGTHRLVALTAFGLLLLHPALHGEVTRRLHPAGLASSLILLALACMLFSRCRPDHRRRWLGGAALATLCAGLLLFTAETQLPGSDTADAATRVRQIASAWAPWTRTPTHAPIIEVDESLRGDFESLVGESLYRDRVRLPDAAAFFSGWSIFITALSTLPVAIDY